MFTTRFFPNSYFAPRYFPKVGAEYEHYIIVKVRDEIRDLNLIGISDANIVVRKVWKRDALNTPNIQITMPTHEDMPRMAGTNFRDDVVYRVMVAMTDKDNRNQTIHRTDYLQWRQSIARHFRCQPLANHRQIYTCEVTPVSLMEPKHWQDGYWVGRILLNFYSREERG